MATIHSPVAGSVWKIEVAVGDEVQAGDELVILESMKMEIPAEAEDAGTVSAIHCSAGGQVAEGDPLVEIA
jgi:acetyl-CoA carboxylase biotin carboxyl carrier protein